METMLLDVPLTGGVDEWDDSRLVAPGSFVLAENLLQDHAGTFRKRWGYGSLPTLVSVPGGASGELPTPRKLASNGEHLVAVGDYETDAYPFLYSYLEGPGAWLRVGSMCAASLTRRPTTRPADDAGVRSHPFTQYNALTGMIVDVWVVSSGPHAGVWLRATEATTRALYVYDTRIATAVGQISVAIVGATVVIVQNATGTGLLAYRFSLTGFTISTTVVANAGGPYFFDLCVLSAGNVMLSYVDQTTSAVNIITESRVASSWALTATVTDVAVARVVAVAVDANPSTVVGAVAWATAAAVGPAAVYCRHRTTTALGTLYAAKLVTATASSATNLAVGMGRADKALVLIEAEITAAQDGIHHDCVTTAGALEAGLSSCFHARIYSRPFTYNNRLWAVVWSRYEAAALNFGSTVLVCLDPDPAAGAGAQANAYYLAGVIARTDSPTMINIGVSTRPPVVVSPTADAKRFLCALSVLTNLSFDTLGTSYPVCGVDELAIDFNESRNGMWTPVRAQDQLYFSGSSPRVYDGQNIVEVGFVDAPRCSSAAVNSGAGTVADGTYLVCVVWEWVDGKGNVMRSAPSTAVSVTVTGGGGLAQIDTLIDTLTLTCKNRRGSGPEMWPVRALVYRTKRNAGGPFYLVSPRGGGAGAVSLQPPVANDTTTFSLSFTDKFADTKQTFGTLYTTGGGQPNILAPPCIHMIAHKGRMFAISADDPRTVYFTKPFQDAVAPEWSESFSFRLDDSPDPPVALASIDDKLVILCGNKLTGSGRVYYVVGDGPNITGQQGEFSQPFLLTSDVGCTEARSVVSYDAGVLFYCRSGIYAIGRDMTVTFAGKAMQDTCTEYWDTCGEGHLDPFRGIAVWQMSSSTDANASGFVALCYQFGTWFRWVGALGSVHCFHNGEHHTNALHVAREAYGTTPGMDIGPVWITSKLRTPWLRMQAVNGYQACQEFEFLGAKKSDCTLRCDVFQDYDATTVRQTCRWLLGPSSPLLGLPVVQVAGAVKTQQCSSIQLEFRDELDPRGPTVDENPAGLDFAGLTLQLGPKKGTARLPAVNRA